MRLLFWRKPTYRIVYNGFPHSRHEVHKWDKYWDEYRFDDYRFLTHFNTEKEALDYVKVAVEHLNQLKREKREAKRRSYTRYYG